MTTITEMVPTYTVGETDYGSNLATDLSINRGDLSQEFQDHPTRFAFYATAYELAIDHVNRLGAELKRLYAMTDIMARNSLATSGVKTTEKMVENTVLSDIDYISLQDKLHDAEKHAGLLKAARDSMMARKDMLVQLGSTARAEHQADISIMARAARENG